MDMIPYIIKNKAMISSQTEYITILENKINAFEAQLNKLTSFLKLKGIYN